jgi:hypothetical protein
MPEKGFVNAKWVASYEAELSDGTRLIPGETIIELGKDEAEQSDNWQPVKAAPNAGGDS